jgi:hypothetical protein
MEKVFPRGERTDQAEVYLRRVGAGRVAYFPWDIDRTFWDVLAADHGKILRNAIDWTLDETPTVAVDGHGVLDVTAWRQRDSFTVHLVNLTNPMMMKGPFREFFPVGEQTVRVRLPNGVKPRAVKLLVAGRDAVSRVEQGALVVTVPSILDHEVVAVDV